MQKYTGATALNHTNLCHCSVFLSLWDCQLSFSSSITSIFYSLLFFSSETFQRQLALEPLISFFQHEHQLFFMSFELHFLRLTTGCYFFSLFFHHSHFIRCNAMGQFDSFVSGNVASLNIHDCYAAGKAISQCFHLFVA